MSANLLVILVACGGEESIWIIKLSSDSGSKIGDLKFRPVFQGAEKSQEMARPTEDAGSWKVRFKNIFGLCPRLLAQLLKP